jgi:hypothetical protein
MQVPGYGTCIILYNTALAPYCTVTEKRLLARNKLLYSTQYTVPGPGAAATVSPISFTTHNATYNIHARSLLLKKKKRWFLYFTIAICAYAWVLYFTIYEFDGVG